MVTLYYIALVYIVHIIIEVLCCVTCKPFSSLAEGPKGSEWHVLVLAGRYKFCKNIKVCIISINYIKVT